MLEKQEREMLQSLTRPCSNCGHCESLEPEEGGWRKILYEQQPFPDNYVDVSFLSSLVTNGDWKRPDFWESVFDTLVLSQRISVLVSFIMIFDIIQNCLISAIEVMLVLNVVGVVLAYCLVLYLIPPKSLEQAFERTFFDSVRLGLFGGALAGLAPILRTLTKSYSSDTIYMLTFILCVIHLIFHDYLPIQRENETQATFQATLSLNATIFASVLLASRLPSSQHVFAFMFLSFCLFIGLPMLSDQIQRRRPPRWHVAMSILLVSVAFALLYRYNGQQAFLFIAFLIFLNVLCPLWLQYIQRYKNHLKGPWDYDTRGELDQL